MQVVILCGGLGTRLREETEFRPKPMVPIGGRPILWHIMKSYAQQGHKDFILCLGYKGEIIREYFRNYHWNTSDVTLRLGAHPQTLFHTTHDEEDWNVTLLDTGLETQTGGRLLRALKQVKEETFLFTYGDGLTNSDINATVKFHQGHGGLATVTAVNMTGRFGELGIDGTRVSSFQEKPERQDMYVSGGFFVLNKRIGEFLDGDSCVLEKGPLQTLSKKGQLHAYKHNGFWHCMDTYREQELLSKMWQAGRAPWKIW